MLATWRNSNIWSRRSTSFMEASQRESSAGWARSGRRLWIDEDPAGCIAVPGEGAQRAAALALEPAQQPVAIGLLHASEEGPQLARH